MKSVVLNPSDNQSIFLLGNEAIVKGALESAVQFVTTYPGTPASEIGDIFAEIAPQKDIYFEFSVNEKVALEAAAGAALSGLKSLVAMKHFGLNVAADFLVPLMYTGIQGGLVIVVADDPGCSSSAQSEQNSRAYSYLAHIPTIEPATPQECKDFVKLAFVISEKFKLPIMVRTTTRVSLQGGVVKLNKISQVHKSGQFIKNSHQFVTMPPRVLEMKKELLEKVNKIKNFITAKTNLNRIYTTPPTKKYQKNHLGIIASGVSFLYVMEALKETQINLPVLKIDCFYPLAETKIKNFIKDMDQILIVEELEPYLEKEIQAIAQTVNSKIKVLGKVYLPEIDELKIENILGAIASLTHKTIHLAINHKTCPLKKQPQLCAGCPYWFVFQAIKNAVNPKKVIFGGEIGCYMLAGLKPHHLQDYLFCMGSSIGVAHGIKKSTQQKLIAFVGDSSFFHAGIPALINCVSNQSNPLIIILDNQTTAMTGHQPHPGTREIEGKNQKFKIKLENIVRACGVKNLKIIDPINVKTLEQVIKDFIDKTEVSVIIARHPCKFIK